MSGSDTEISVAITATTDELESGMHHAAEEVESGAEQMKEAIEGAKEAFATFAELLGVGLSIEWMKEIIDQSVEAAETVNHLTQSLGMSAESIQTMAFAAGLVGGNLDTATMAMTRLERAGEQAIAGAKQQAEAFNSIGISSSQLAELLKQPDELIKTVAEDLSGFGNGAAKTAVVMQLFGRNAAQMIPLLNELGSNFDELKEKGEQFGVVLSSQDQESLFQTAESMNQLKEAAVGLGNEFAVALAPAVKALVDNLIEMANSDFVKSMFATMKTDVAELVVVLGQVKSWLGSVISEFPEVGEYFHSLFSKANTDVAGFVADSMTEIDQLITLVRNGAVYIEIAFQESWAAVQNGFGAMLSWIETQIAALAQKESSMLSNIPLTGTWQNQLNDLATSMNNASAAFKPVVADVSDLTAQIVKNNAELVGAKAENDAWAQSVRDAATASSEHGEALDATGKKVLDYNAKVGSATDAMAKLNDELVKWSEGNDKLLGTQDPVTKALMGFDSEMLKASQELVVMIGHGLDYYAALGMLQQRVDLATASEQKSIAAFYTKADVLDTLVQKYIDQSASVEAYTNSSKAQLVVDQAIDKEMQSLIEQYGAESDAVKAANVMLLANRDASVANITALLNHEQEVKNDQAVMKEWATITQSSFDSAFQAINKDIIEGGSIMTDLVKVAQNVVEAILLEFEKLAIINPLLNSIFGGQGGFTILPTLANSALGGLGGVGGLANGAGSLLSGNGLLGNLFGDSWVSNFFGSTAGAGSGLMGALFGGAGGFDMLTAGSGDLVSLGATGDVGAWMTQGLGLDGAYGASGATSGVLGSGGDVLGGLGNLGGVLGGAMAGYQVGGLGGAAALGALSYAFPVIGWIAGAASLVNSLTGGDLFGTGPEPTGVSFEGLNLGQSGFQYNDAIQTHSHGALLSGGSWGQQSQPITADQATSEQAMTAAMQQTLTSAASALGTTVGNLITGSFSEQLSSTGAVSSNLSKVLGQTYTDTIQQFAERVTADNLLALLPATQNAMAIANQWQSSADTLLAGTQMLVQAQVDINKGMSLLGSDSSLADITAVVQQLAQQGETLPQTYARLQTEQEDLKATLDQLGMTTGKTGADFVTFADQLTQAAGGLQNLQSEWTAYYSAYYSQAEQQAQTMKQLQDTVNTTFAAIGENSKESMAQFRTDFTAAMPTLTPAQVQEWLAAADALAKLTAANQALTAAAAQQTAADQAAAQAIQAAKQKYEDFVDQFQPATYGATSFESSLTKLYTTMMSNEQQANALAQAAGMAGASQLDMANIIQAAANDGVAALKSFEAQTEQLAQQLYGTNVQQLTTQLTALQAQYTTAQQNGDYASLFQLGPQIAATQSQITAANAQAQAAQRLSDASTLLQDLGQIGSVTGQSLSDLAKQMSIPLDQFAKDLGISPDQVNQQYQQIELQAQAAIKANEYLQDILNVLQGKPADSIFSPTSQTLIPGAGNRSPHREDQIAQKLDLLINHFANLNSTAGRTLDVQQEIAISNRQMAQGANRIDRAGVGSRNERYALSGATR